MSPEAFRQDITAYADSLDPLSSLLIWHRDSIIVETYFRGMAPSRGQNIKSASKSILSALVGAAVQSGDIESIDLPIGHWLPEYFLELTDPAKQTITLRHLLKMRSGLESTSFDNYGAWASSPDWIRNALERPMECAPDTCWGYSTGSSHLVSAILTRATGMSTRAYADQVLFGPLGISLDGWDRDPLGIYLGGNNMVMSPREMLLFGRLYLNGGIWNGRRVFSDSWLNESWQRYARSPWNRNHYGYFWWSRDLGDEAVYFAWGFGGQYIFVVPRLELVVVSTASLSNRPPGVRHNPRVYRMLSDAIIPAIRALHPTYSAPAR